MKRRRHRYARTCQWPGCKEGVAFGRKRYCLGHSIEAAREHSQRRAKEQRGRARKPVDVSKIEPEPHVLLAVRMLTGRA